MKPRTKVGAIVSAVVGVLLVGGLVVQAQTGFFKTLADQITGTSNQFNVDVSVIKIQDGNRSALQGTKNIYTTNGDLKFPADGCKIGDIISSVKNATGGDLKGAITGGQETKSIKLSILEDISDYFVRVQRTNEEPRLTSCRFSILTHSKSGASGGDEGPDEGGFGDQVYKISNPTAGGQYSVTFAYSGSGDDDNPPTESNGSIKVKILDQSTGTAVSGASLSVALYKDGATTSTKTETTSTGEVEFTGLKAGSYRAVANGSGCSYAGSAEGATTITGIGSGNIEIKLDDSVAKDKTKLDITVSPEGVNPGVDVRVYKNDATSAESVKTDAKGKAIICLVGATATDIYNVKFSKVGVNPTEATLTGLQGGETEPVNATMSETPKTFNLTGTVVDGQTQDKTAGATVSFNGQTGSGLPTTNSQGVFEIKDIGSPDQQTDFLVSVSKSGYRTGEGNVSISAGNTDAATVGTIKLYRENATATVSGTVKITRSADTTFQSDATANVSLEFKGGGSLNIAGLGDIVKNASGNYSANPYVSSWNLEAGYLGRQARVCVNYSEPSGGIEKSTCGENNNWFELQPGENSNKNIDLVVVPVAKVEVPVLVVDSKGDPVVGAKVSLIKTELDAGGLPQGERARLGEGTTGIDGVAQFSVSEQPGRGTYEFAAAFGGTEAATVVVSLAGPNDKIIDRLPSKLPDGRKCVKIKLESGNSLAVTYHLYFFAKLKTQGVSVADLKKLESFFWGQQTVASPPQAKFIKREGIAQAIIGRIKKVNDKAVPIAGIIESVPPAAVDGPDKIIVQSPDWFQPGIKGTSNEYIVTVIFKDEAAKARFAKNLFVNPEAAMWVLPQRENLNDLLVTFEKAKLGRSTILQPSDVEIGVDVVIPFTIGENGKNGVDVGAFAAMTGKIWDFANEVLVLRNLVNVAGDVIGNLAAGVGKVIDEINPFGESDSTQSRLTKFDIVNGYAFVEGLTAGKYRLKSSSEYYAFDPSTSVFEVKDAEATTNVEAKVCYSEKGVRTVQNKTAGISSIYLGPLKSAAVYNFNLAVNQAKAMLKKADIAQVAYLGNAEKTSHYAAKDFGYCVSDGTTTSERKTSGESVLIPEGLSDGAKISDIASVINYQAAQIRYGKLTAKNKTAFKKIYNKAHKIDGFYPVYANIYKASGLGANETMHETYGDYRAFYSVAVAAYKSDPVKWQELRLQIESMSKGALKNTSKALMKSVMETTDEQDAAADSAYEGGPAISDGGYSESDIANGVWTQEGYKKASSAKKILIKVRRALGI